MGVKIKEMWFVEEVVKLIGGHFAIMSQLEYFRGGAESPQGVKDAGLDGPSVVSGDAVTLLLLLNAADGVNTLAPLHPKVIISVRMIQPFLNIAVHWLQPLIKSPINPMIHLLHVSQVLHMMFG